MFVNTFAMANATMTLQVNMCKDCPSGAKSCYADTLVLEQGYWRIASSAVDALLCPIENGCVGGWRTGQELCAAGYEVSGG